MGNHAATHVKSLCQAASAAVLAGVVLAACHDKGALESSRVEYVRVDGRRFEVRATIVLDPNPEAERSRAENVAKPFMERSCRGQSYKVLEDVLIDNVTLSLHFRCVV